MGRGVGTGRVTGVGSGPWLALLTVAVLIGCSPGPDDGATAPTFRPGSLGTSTPEPMVGRLVLDRESGRVIEGLIISNPDGNCIEVSRSTEIVIRDSVIGPCGGKAINIRRSEDIRIEETEFIDAAAGVYALDSQNVVVTASIFTNAGRNPVQFDKVSGPGNRISDNEIHNLEGSPSTEDSISIYQSSGTEVSPLLIRGNLIVNGGSSGSGSGILVGDHGGSYVVVTENTLINPGQVGIGVAGGHTIRVVDNTVFSESYPWSNVGIYVWDQYQTRCQGIEVSGNVVQWHDRDGGPNAFFDAGNCGEVTGWEMNETSSELKSILADLYGELFE